LQANLTGNHIPPGERSSGMQKKRFWRKQANSFVNLRLEEKAVKGFCEPTFLLDRKCLQPFLQILFFVGFLQFLELICCFFCVEM
jgi:hypothetical protein